MATKLDCRIFFVALLSVTCLMSLSAQISFTSVQSGNWEDGATWGNTSPGSAGIDYPDNNGDDDITIASGNKVTLQSNSTINNFTINSDGVFAYGGYTLTVNGTATPFISVQTGSYTNNSTWLGGAAPGTTDRVIICSGHAVTTNTNPETISDITIDAGAVLATPNNKDIAITSNLVVNGTLLLNQGNADLRITGATTISGTGIIDGSQSSQGAMQVEANASIGGGSNLTFLNDIDITGSFTLTINGSAIISNGDITGVSAASQVTMGSSGNLEIDGVLLSTGTLDASTNAGNTVEYNNVGIQSIKLPSSSVYNHLIISGTDTKTFPASAVTINGDLTITSGTLDINNQPITIAGDWINNSAFTNISSVNFNGTSDQNITNPGSGQDFTSIVINKTSGDLVLNNSVVVTTSLTMTQGDIDANSHTFALGSGGEATFNYTSGRIIGTFGQYVEATITGFQFPVGTSTYDRFVNITFDDSPGNRSAGMVYLSFVESEPGTNGFPIGFTSEDTLYNTFNEGYWDFTSSDFKMGNGDFNITVEGQGFSSFSINDSSRMVTRTDAGSNWELVSDKPTVDGDSVSQMDITYFPLQIAMADTTNCSGPADPTFSAGNTEVCTGDNDNTYTVSLNSGNEYSWTVVGGTIDEAGGATSTGYVTDLNSITVDWGSNGQEGSVSVTEKNSCTISNTVSRMVNINSMAPSSISGSTYVPENEQDVSYSVTNESNTTYTWSISGDGSIDIGQGTNFVTIDWGSNGTATISVTATKTSPSCTVSSATELVVTKYIVVESSGSGNWNSDATWVTGAVPLSTESARIVSGHTVTLAGGGTNAINNLTINGTLDVNSRDITVNGDLTINSGGAITGTSGILQMTGSSSSPQNKIEGTGSIDGAFTIQISNGSKTVSSTAVISQTGTGTNLDIDAGLQVTNNGSIQIGGNITGAAATSIWTNATNSTLTIGGDLLTTGTLNADASGNTVIYNSATAANMKTPASGYQNLKIETGTKTLAATIDVNGDFTLTSGTFAMGANNMSMAGNLIYTAGSLTATTGTVTLDGASNQVVSGSWIIPNLTINNSLDGADAITLSNGMTVSTLLTLTDGIVGTGSNVLTVSNTATGGLSGGSSACFINGILARPTNTTSLYDFPVGKSTTYKRLGLTPTGTTGSTYQVEAFNTAYSDVSTMGVGVYNVSELEYWDVRRTAGSDGAQVRLYWNTQSASGITTVVGLLVAHYTGGQWEDQGNGANSGDVDPGYVESSTAVNTFSPLTFGSSGSSENPLPVTWKSFKAVKTSTHVKLEWVTASEIDNDRFEIERSADGKTFTKIGEVAGAGNADELLDYVFYDQKPYYGVAYYRLKQVDYDGQYEYSRSVVVVNDQLRKGIEVTIYPNPAGRENLNLRLLSGDETSLIHMRIVDVSGREFYQSTVPHELGASGYKIIPDNHMPLGLYFVLIRQGEHEEKVKLLIK